MAKLVNGALSHPPLLGVGDWEGILSVKMSTAMSSYAQYTIYKEKQLLKDVSAIKAHNSRLVSNKMF